MSTTADEDELRALADRLLAEAKLAPTVAASRLSGGKNNRVYRLDLADGARRVLKLYHADARDLRDRRGAEWRFLTYAWQRDVRTVPEPIATDPALGASLYGFVAGRRIATEEVDLATVLRAADFVAAVNAPPREPGDLAPASEACFTLADHLGTVDKRVERLSGIDREAPMADAATSFVVDRLRPAWQRVRAEVLRVAERAGTDLSRPIDTVVVSPSDFGFHNMLRDDAGRDAFIDFEYAGRDDAAKLVCDFFCQPEVPVPVEHFQPFLDRLAVPLALTEADRRRCGLLLNVYRVKWVCIILNEFLAVGAARRAFADDGERAARCARQLERAARGLSFVTP